VQSCITLQKYTPTSIRRETNMTIEIDQLKGQIRALEDAFIALACAAEISGSIDGEGLTQYLDNFADRYRPRDDDDQKIEQAVYAKETLQRIANHLRDARTGRAAAR
jgi:hypothetical protein